MPPVSIRAPLSRAGRHAGAPSKTGRMRVSIRAPLSRAGRPPGTLVLFLPRPVSIRAPLSRAGRLGARVGYRSARTFQSAPRSHERGDAHFCDPSRRQRGFNPRPALTSGATIGREHDVARGEVSIRAPLSRAGRRVEEVGHRASCRVSIRAPLSRAGRLFISAKPFGKRSFNPRPALTSGATIERKDTACR